MVREKSISAVFTALEMDDGVMRMQPAAFKENQAGEVRDCKSVAVFFRLFYFYGRFQMVFDA